MLVHTLFLGFKAQAYLLARLSSRRVRHYDFHGAFSSQRGSLRGLDALRHGLQYMLQWFVDNQNAIDMRVILTRLRLRCWYNDCHLGRQAIQRVLPHDTQSPRDSCRHSMGVYWACSALRWWHSGELCWSSLGFETVHCADVHWSVSAALLEPAPTVAHYADPETELFRSCLIPTVFFSSVACSQGLVLGVSTLVSLSSTTTNLLYTITNITLSIQSLRC